MKRGDLRFIVMTVVFLTAGILLLVTFSSLFAKTIKNTPGGFNQSETQTNAELVVPNDANAVYTDLQTALTNGANSKDSRCIITHPTFPQFAKISGNSANVKLSSGDTGMILSLFDAYGRLIKETTVQNIKPCIVSGQAALNFYDNYFGSKKGTMPEFIEVSSLAITGQEDVVINGQSASLSLNDNDCCGSQKINVLYKADAQHICFLPTYRFGSDASVDGFNNDFIATILGKSNIKSCTITR